MRGILLTCSTNLSLVFSSKDSMEFLTVSNINTDICVCEKKGGGGGERLPSVYYIYLGLFQGTHDFKFEQQPK